MLLDTPNAGFVMATPVGIALGSVMAALSRLDLSGPLAVRVTRLGRLLRWVLLALMAVWALVSIAQLPPLRRGRCPNGPVACSRASRCPPCAVRLSAVRYLQLWRRRPSWMLLAMMSAFVLLAEAMIAVVFARNWAL